MKNFKKKNSKNFVFSWWCLYTNKFQLWNFIIYPNYHEIQIKKNFFFIISFYFYFLVISKIRFLKCVYSLLTPQIKYHKGNKKKEVWCKLKAGSHTCLMYSDWNRLALEPNLSFFKLIEILGTNLRRIHFENELS